MRDDVDLHIHTVHCGCGNETMQVADLIDRCYELGYRYIAITDHYNGPQHYEAQKKIREDLREYDGPIAITWGVECTIADPEAGTVTVDEELIAEMAFEFVIGGPHGRYEETEPEAIIETQHGLMLATVRNPIIDALVHPWWFSRLEWERETMTWFTDMSLITERHVDELAQACVETGTSVEMNAGGILYHPHYSEKMVDDYRNYLAALCERGVTFTLCSDAHDIGNLERAKDAARFLAEAGVPDEQIAVPAATDLASL